MEPADDAGEEADVLTADKPDLDWKWLAKDATKLGLDASTLESVTYGVYATATLADDGEVFGSHKWTLTFSKPVVASTVSVSAFSLTRDGVAVALPASAKLTQVSDTVWTVSGLDSELAEDGA